MRERERERERAWAQVDIFQASPHLPRCCSHASRVTNPELTFAIQSPADHPAAISQQRTNMVASDRDCD